MINYSNAIKVFGGQGDQASRAGNSTASQDDGEVVTTAGISRRVKSPRANGHFSYHARVTEASAGGAITVWYSNLPNPDVDTDDNWVQDTTIGSLVLTGVASFFGNVGNVFAEWIRYKVLPTGDNASVYIYHRAEGVEY